LVLLGHKEINIHEITKDRKLKDLIGGESVIIEAEKEKEKKKERKSTSKEREKKSLEKIQFKNDSQQQQQQQITSEKESGREHSKMTYVSPRSLLSSVHSPDRSLYTVISESSKLDSSSLSRREKTHKV
jgi:hypothetical protein